MNDEIKKVIDYLNIKGYKMVGVKQKKILLDYITNLQEENEKNKEYSEFYKDMSNKWKDMSDVFKKSCKDYKSRIDKAIEYINNGYLSDGEMVNILVQQDLLSILQGE